MAWQRPLSSHCNVVHFTVLKGLRVAVLCCKNKSEISCSKIIRNFFKEIPPKNPKPLTLCQAGVLFVFCISNGIFLSELAKLAELMFQNLQLCSVYNRTFISFAHYLAFSFIHNFCFFPVSFITVTAICHLFISRICINSRPKCYRLPFFLPSVSKMLFQYIHFFLHSRWKRDFCCVLDAAA